MSHGLRDLWAHCGTPENLWGQQASHGISGHPMGPDSTQSTLGHLTGFANTCESLCCLWGHHTLRMGPAGITGYPMAPENNHGAPGHPMGSTNTCGSLCYPWGQQAPHGTMHHTWGQQHPTGPCTTHGVSSIPQDHAPPMGSAVPHRTTRHPWGQQHPTGPRATHGVSSTPWDSWTLYGTRVHQWGS